MKRLVFSGLLVTFLFASCDKDDFIEPAYRKAQPNPTATVKIELLTMQGEGTTYFADQVQFNISDKFSPNYKAKEDTLDAPKQANDLGINDANQVLRVNSIPFDADSIPVIIQRPISQAYWFKVTSTNLTNNIYLFDNYFKTASMNTPVKDKILLNSNGVTWWYFEPNNYYKTNRFYLVIK